MHESRVLGILMVGVGTLLAPFIFFDLAYKFSPADMTDSAAAVYAGLIALGAWFAFIVTPPAVFISSSAKSGAAEKRFWAGAFGAAAVLCPLLQIASELVRGPWYGILGFMMKAAIANGAWFMIWGAVMHARNNRVDKKQPQTLEPLPPESRAGPAQLTVNRQPEE